MFTEVPFLERFELAAKAGFEAVECLFPYADPAGEITARLNALGLQQVLFNSPPGDWNQGERGFGALPNRRKDFRKSIELAIRYAEALDCPRLHVMAGVVAPRSKSAECRNVFVENLAWAAGKAGNAGVTLMLEPLNPIDVPGYFLNSVAQVRDIISAVGQKNVQYQFDAYHLQMTQGRLTETFQEMLPLIGHIQVSGVPGRCEPDEHQEINFRHLFNLIAESSYAGWVGCEYRPRNGTDNGLGWIDPWRRSPFRK